MLPESDREYLAGTGQPHEVKNAGNEIHIIFTDFDFPDAYSPRKAKLLVKIPAGYPNANPDMFWTSPDIKLANGNWPHKADVHEPIGPESWQRWSRHFPNGSWRPGVDSLQTFIATIHVELSKAI